MVACCRTASVAIVVAECVATGVAGRGSMEGYNLQPFTFRIRSPI